VSEPLDNRRERTARAPDGTTYRLLAAKRGLPLLPEAWGGGVDLPSMVLSFIFEIVMDVRADGEAVWKLGVYRKGRFLLRRVLKERLPAGEDPGRRLDELGSQIKDGQQFSSASQAQ
jgi:hypothetical protein